MRLVGLILLVFIIVVVTAIILSVLGYVGFSIYGTVKQVVNQTVSTLTGGRENISDYDVVEKTGPMWLLVNIALILAIIFAVVAVFMHSRRR